MSKAPSAKDLFPNARANNDAIVNLTNETIRAADLSYIIKTPKFKGRLTGYFSEILNVANVNFFYADDLISSTSNSGIVTNQGAFVSEVVTGINKKNRGIELGLDYQISATIRLTAVAAYGNFNITNNPMASLHDDSKLLATTLSIPQESKLKGYKQAGSPQQAYAAGIEYRDPKFWWIGANANYMTENYIAISVIKRTDNYYTSLANNGLTIDKEKAESYLKQEKFSPIRLVNLVGGISWKIVGNYTIGLSANINNLLNIKYKTGGFEQSRNASYKQDYQDHYSGGPLVFGSKYFNGYGRTYMANIYLNF